jgi:hypothetical protein
LVEKSGDGLTVGEKEQLFTLMQQYADIFARSKSDLGCTEKSFIQEMLTQSGNGFAGRTTTAPAGSAGVIGMNAER